VESLDVRLILTLAGMAVSVVSAAVIVKTKLAAVIETLSDIESRLRKLDSTVDRQHSQQEVMTQRMSILSAMNSPEHQERKAREAQSMLKDIEHIKLAVNAICKG